MAVHRVCKEATACPQHLSGHSSRSYRSGYALLIALERLHSSRWIPCQFSHAACQCHQDDKLARTQNTTYTNKDNATHITLRTR